MAINADEMIVACEKLLQGKISLAECMSEMDQCEQQRDNGVHGSFIE